MSRDGIPLHLIDTIAMINPPLNRKALPAWPHLIQDPERDSLRSIAYLKLGLPQARHLPLGLAVISFLLHVFLWSSC